MIGRTISHYHITEKLGGGGMGIVYKATDQRLDRTVALKFLPPHLSSDPEANVRFTREAKTASALDHANICTIFDIGETDEGQLFIVMAFYEGQTLKYRMADGPLAIEACVDITLQIARGLERAHEVGIVHRDIKPPNLMVTDRGEVKVLDFGVAKLSEGDDLTMAGSTVGTTAYMSPEQAQGQAVDARTDIWALGVVLYQMLTGRKPFEGDYRQAILYAIINEDPEPVQSLRPEVPEALAMVVDKALEKDPETRYADMGALIDDLQGLQRGTPSGTSTRAPTRVKEKASSKRSGVLVGAAVALLIVLGLGWFVLQGGLGSSEDVPSTPERTAIAVLPFAVQGGDDLAYLEEGMVTLLSTKLDGAGTLRSVDPKAVLGYLARHPDRVLDPAGGRDVALHFEAGRFILGTVLRVGTEVQLLASLYDAQGLELKEAQASISSNDELMKAVDALARQLLAALLDETDQQLASQATGTTTSFVALKAYLEGEQALRDGRFQEAVEAAQRAVQADSTFALGWYLLIQGLGWINQPGAVPPDTAWARVVRYSDGLTNRVKTLIEANGAARAGNTDEAERLYRSHLRAYPDDIEAWGQLGDLLYHYNPLRGRPASEALDAFERVLFYDPDNSEFNTHWMEIAGKERNYAVFDSLATRYLQSDLAQNSRRDLYWLVRGRPEAKDSVIALYRSAPPGRLAGEAIQLVLTEHIETAQQLAEAYVDAATTPQAEAMGKGFYAFASIARGQWARGRAAFAAFAALNPTPAPPVGEVILHAVLPYRPATSTLLDSLEQRVAAWDTTAAPAPLHPGQQGDLQAYALGLLRWEQDDMEGAQRYADELRQRARPEEKNNLAHSFARTLDALIAWYQGQLDEALSALDEAQLEPAWSLANSSPFYYQALNRYARAEILYAQQRYEEALPWYTSLHDGFYFIGTFYLGPSYLRRAEIYEHLGDTENAIAYYARFVDLWEDADVYLQPQVEQARQRLNHLLDASAREPSDVARPSATS